ncbi:hypothetical protein EDB89DRAFT_1913338 [Lactarius sanguifluus]|nr:hypothetical protein EDB89DRAFT_1913338 [Lactarius sanguifluus]
MTLRKWKFQLNPLSPPLRQDSKDSKVHKFPETLRQALDTIIISAFRKPNKLVVHADSFSFNIEFSCDEVDVAATSASIDEDLVLLAKLTSPSRHFHYVHYPPTMMDPFIPPSPYSKGYGARTRVRDNQLFRTKENETDDTQHNNPPPSLTMGTMICAFSNGDLKVARESQQDERQGLVGLVK